MALGPEEARSRLRKLSGWSMGPGGEWLEGWFDFGTAGDAVAALAYAAARSRLRGWREAIEIAGNRLRLRIQPAGGGQVTAAEFLAARELGEAVVGLGARRGGAGSEGTGAVDVVSE